MALPAVLFGALLAIFILRRLASRWRLRARRSQNGCHNPPHYPHKDPFFGLDLFFAQLKARKRGNTLASDQNTFARVGKTYECNSWGARQIQTMDPENIHAVLVSSFDKFGVQAMRLAVAEPFIGPGVFSTDGPYWQYSRELIRPMFTRAEISDFDALQLHLDRMLERIPSDGSTIELQSLLKLMYLDHSTEMIFGKSTATLLQKTPDEESNELLQTYTAALQRLGLHIVLGRVLVFRFLDRTYAKLCRRVHAVIDKYIDEAVMRRNLQPEPSSSLISNTADTAQGHFVIVDELVKLTNNRDEIRNQLLNIFLPARDAAGIALSGVLFHLARHPDVWKKLRAEVMTIKAEKITYNDLQSLSYMKAVLNESLRLTAPAAANRRQATGDVILPTGGGPTGKFPIFVSKGDFVTVNFGALQRDPSIWGDDADKFCPERWNSLKAIGAIYMPFSLGPRICPGKQMTLSENAYVLVQLMRRFVGLENRDERMEFVEQSRLTTESRRGVLVGLTPAGKE